MNSEKLQKRLIAEEIPIMISSSPSIYKAFNPGDCTSPSYLIDFNPYKVIQSPLFQTPINNFSFLHSNRDTKSVIKQFDSHLNEIVPEKNDVKTADTEIDLTCRETLLNQSNITESSQKAPKKLSHLPIISPEQFKLTFTPTGLTKISQVDFRLPIMNTSKEIKIDAKVENSVRKVISADQFLLSEEEANSCIKSFRKKMIFLKPKLIYSNSKEKSNSQNSKAQCKFCHQRFSSGYALGGHMARKHRKNEINKLGIE